MADCVTRVASCACFVAIGVKALRYVIMRIPLTPDLTLSYSFLHLFIPLFLHSFMHLFRVPAGWHESGARAGCGSSHWGPQQVKCYEVKWSVMKWSEELDCVVKCDMRCNDTKLFIGLLYKSLLRCVITCTLSNKHTQVVRGVSRFAEKGRSVQGQLHSYLIHHYEHLHYDALYYYCMYTNLRCSAVGDRCDYCSTTSVSITVYRVVGICDNGAYYTGLPKYILLLLLLCFWLFTVCINMRCIFIYLPVTGSNTESGDRGDKTESTAQGDK